MAKQNKDKFIGIRVTVDEFDRLMYLAGTARLGAFILSRAFSSPVKSKDGGSLSEEWEVIERGRRDLGIKISDGVDIRLIYPEDSNYQKYFDLQ